VQSSVVFYTLVLPVMAFRHCALIVVLGTGLLVSCSLTTYAHEPCASNADCRAAFGLGSTCSADGLCSPTEQNPRCTRTYPTDLFTRPLRYTDSIVLGAIVNESDPSDLVAENAIELAVKQVNDFDGVDGRPFGVVFCTNQLNSALDTATEEEATAALGTYLTNDLGVPAILGPSTSSQAAALHAAVAPLGTLMISHSATSTALTQLDGTRDLFWRTCAPDSEQGAAIADDLTARGVSTVAVIFEEGPYGTGLTDVFTAAFSGTATRFPFELGNTTARDSQAMAVATRASEFSEILFISSNFSDTQQFLSFAASFAGLSTMQFFLTDTAAASRTEFLSDTVAAPLFPRIRGSMPAHAAGDVYAAFEGAYTARFTAAPDVESYAPYAYDAAWLAFASAVWSLQLSGSIRGADMADGLEHVSDLTAAPPPVALLPGSWQALSTELAAGRDVNVNGASGTLDFDPITHETSGPVEIWTISAAVTPPVLVVDHIFPRGP
jgi:branched-chain amino acid transport system substrate-binding protein